MFIWTIGDAVAVIVILCSLLIALAMAIRVALRIWLCRHDGGVRETMACEAICLQCGGNLGFIGTWREKHKQQPQAGRE